MNVAKYLAEGLTRHTGVPVCLIKNYAQIVLLGEQRMPQEGTSPTGLELVDLEDFIQCATEVIFKGLGTAMITGFLFSYNPVSFITAPVVWARSQKPEHYDKQLY